MIARTPTPRPVLLLLLCAMSPLAYGFQRSEETAILAERDGAIEQVSAS